MGTMITASAELSQKLDEFLDSDLLSESSQIDVGFRTIKKNSSHTEKRLVVLIPDQDVDEVKISRKILSQAFTKRLDIVLLTLVQAHENEFSARRRLVTIMSLLKGLQLHVETKIALGHSWIKMIRQIRRNGDVIFCPAELMASSRLGIRKPLGAILKDTLHVGVITYSDFYHDTHVNGEIYLHNLIYWIILIAIFVVFFIFDVDLNLFTMGWAGQVIAFMIVIVEIGIIYYWTSIAG